MELAGTRLKKVRLEKGLSLEEVHKKTKVHLDILKAIEEDRLINISPVYIKGFLKIYCKFLGVDPAEFIGDYKGQQSTVRYVSDAQEKPASLLKRASVKLVSLKGLDKRIKKVFIFILIAIFLSIVLFNLGKVVSSKLSALASGKKKLEKKVEITKSQKVKIPTVIPQSRSTEIAPQVGSTLKLGIRAKEDCWIQLRADGRVVFQSILRKGRVETWQAKNKIELSLGNAGVVDLEINGKLISSLGRKGQVLKNIVITKEGITVGQ
jgi:cytoskeletal protein RodZ